MRRNFQYFMHHTLSTWIAVSIEIMLTATFYAILKTLGVTENDSLLFCSILAILFVLIGILISYKLIPSFKEKNNRLAVSQLNVRRESKTGEVNERTDNDSIRDQQPQPIARFLIVQLIALVGWIIVQATFLLSPLSHNIPFAVIIVIEAIWGLATFAILYLLFRQEYNNFVAAARDLQEANQRLQGQFKAFPQS